MRCWDRLRSTVGGGPSLVVKSMISVVLWGTWCFRGEVVAGSRLGLGLLVVDVVLGLFSFCEV